MEEGIKKYKEERDLAVRKAKWEKFVADFKDKCPGGKPAGPWDILIAYAYHLDKTEVIDRQVQELYEFAIKYVILEPDPEKGAESLPYEVEGRSTFDICYAHHASGIADAHATACLFLDKNPGIQDFILELEEEIGDKIGHDEACLLILAARRYSHWPDHSSNLSLDDMNKLDELLQTAVEMCLRERLL